MPTKRTLLTAALLLALPAVALAHGPSRGPNGGQMLDIGDYHGELLAQDGRLTFFLYDTNDRPLPASGASATAIVLAGGRQQTLTFAPQPDGKALVASGDFRAEASLRVVVQLVPAAGKPRVQARYAPIDAAK
ncbi:MAG: fimbrial protein [Alphaproteobacteria bacterium]|nr:fimbrial protein [Alphaproteobacteria bacterium]